MIANLINLVFFIFLLGAVEIVPLLIGLFMGRPPSSTLGGSATFSKFRNRLGEAVVAPAASGIRSEAPALRTHQPSTLGDGSGVGNDAVADQSVS